MGVFYKLILSFLVSVTRHSESTQNEKLACLCKKSMGVEVDFLHADKHETLLQVSSITLALCCQAYPKHPKHQVYFTFTISQGKCEGWSYFFFLLINVKDFKMILSF